MKDKHKDKHRLYSWSTVLYPHHLVDLAGIDDEVLRNAIKENGIDTISILNGTVIEYTCDMTMDQVDIVLSFKPNLIAKKTIYCPLLCNDHNIDTLQKLLEYDVEGLYNTHQYVYACREVGTLYDLFVLEKETFKTPERAKTLISNHRNKWISLFDLMKPCLEESDKKRRF